MEDIRKEMEIEALRALYFYLYYLWHSATIRRQPMTLDEAIEIKTHPEKYPITSKGSKWVEADRMSIEALKRIDDMRTSPCSTADEILPGETKE